MKSGVRSVLVMALPLVVLAGLMLIFRRGAVVEDRGPGQTSLQAPAAEWIPMDLNQAESTETIPGWDVRRGSYELENAAGKKLLKLLPEPLVEGKVMWTRAMRGTGGVRARMQGDRSRRTFPRFSVGLNQEREWHLRAFPGERKLELVSCQADLSNEVLLTSQPLPDWQWKPEDWVWLELQIAAAPDGTAIAEGRLWTAGEPRPDEAQLTHQLTQPPAVFFAALQGAPFALKPILIDAAETRPSQGSFPP